MRAVNLHPVETNRRCHLGGPPVALDHQLDLGVRHPVRGLACCGLGVLEAHQRRAPDICFRTGESAEMGQLQQERRALGPHGLDKSAVPVDGLLRDAMEGVRQDRLADDQADAACRPPPQVLDITSWAHAGMTEGLTSTVCGDYHPVANLAWPDSDWREQGRIGSLSRCDGHARLLASVRWAAGGNALLDQAVVSRQWPTRS